MVKRKRYSKQKLEKEHFTNSTDSDSEEDIKKKQDADMEEDEADDECEETEEPKPRRGKRTNDSDAEAADDKDIEKKQDTDMEEDEADDECEETEEPKPRRGKRTNDSDAEAADDKHQANSEESESEEEEVPRKNERKIEDNNTAEGENDSEYEVESIVDDRKIKGKTQYRVRWKGFSSAHDTWEDEENLDCENLLNEYLSSKGQTSNDENTEKRKNNKNRNKGKKRAQGIKSNAHGNKKHRADVKPDENGEFEISRIIDMHVAKNGKHEYLVLWKGFPPSESSWEPEEHVKETAAYDRFLKKLEEAKSISVKELRVSRRPTDRFTMTYHDKGRRLSRRFENKQRAKYFEAE